MKLSELQDSWTEDCKINEMDLGKESARTPNLHAKYLNYLTSTRINLRKAESDYFNLRRLKYKYYRGELTKEELAENNLTQWLVSSIRSIHGDMERHTRVGRGLPGFF